MIFYILPLNREARDLKPQMQMYLFLSFFQMRCFQNMLQKLTCTVATYLFPLYVIWAVWQSSGKGGLMQTLWQRTLGKISTLKKKDSYMNFSIVVIIDNQRLVSDGQKQSQFMGGENWKCWKLSGHMYSMLNRFISRNHWHHWNRSASQQAR